MASQNEQLLELGDFQALKSASAFGSVLSTVSESKPNQINGRTFIPIPTYSSPRKKAAWETIKE